MKNMMKAAIVAGAMVAAVPASAQVVNLSATDSSKSTQTLTLAAGSYTVSLAGMPRGTYNAWAPATPGDVAFNSDGTQRGGNWTNYYDYSINNGPRQVYNPIETAGQPYRFDTADAAFAAYTAAGPLNLTFATQGTVSFFIRDEPGSFGDNSGGVSLSVSAVPEPATWAMMLMGVFTIGGALRSTRRKGQASASGTSTRKTRRASGPFGSRSPAGA